MTLKQTAGLLIQLSEAAKSKVSKPLDLIDYSFQKQSDFLCDLSSFKAGFCTRRAGKSYGAATLMFQTALNKPGSSVLYIALTRDSAKKIMWKDCIKVLNLKHGLNCKFNETLLTATLPNGSVIYLTGADAKPDEMEKLLGQKYALVVIDEAASFKQDLRKLVYGILKPAVADYRGQIVMIGTPGNLTKGLFYDITNGKEPGWSLHKWSAFDNPYMATQWKAEIEELKRTHPGIENTPLFKQMYLGEWFIDTDKLVYKYSEDRNIIDELPDQDYHYVLGVDLGYDPDPSAFVLCAYAEHDPNLYIIETYKKTKLLISDIAERIRHTMRRYPGCRVVVDAGGQGKQIVEEMRQKLMLPLEAAEKTGKHGFIEIMNAEMIMGRVKVLRSASDPITEEWSTLIWDENSSTRTENPACPNHLSDAALYAWRFCYNYAWKEKQVKIERGSEREVDAFWDKEASRIERNKNLPFWERDDI